LIIEADLQQATSHLLPRQRDHRLDLARGFMLLIIFIAHVPNNLWADYIPARFGFSSGAEIFVFVSGITSGIAFGGSFLKKGFATGSRRIFKRILQLYGAHIALLLGLGFGALWLDQSNGNDVLAARYGLELLRDEPLNALIAYASLRYVPAFFDILPMYVILLALIPPAILLARISPYLVLAASAFIWLITPIFGLHLPAHPHSGATWYFNPFAWQFLFFIGFSFGIGWLKAPPRKHAILFPLAVAILIVSVPLTGWPFFQLFNELFVQLNAAIYPPDAITILHHTRLIHFLSLAYVCFSLIDPKAAWLAHPRIQPLYRIGRNSFPCFLAGVVLSLIGGIVIDLLGMGWSVAHIVNLLGMGLLLAFATLMDQVEARAKVKLVTAPLLDIPQNRGEAATLT
jgi:hypothetical protein